MATLTLTALVVEDTPMIGRMIVRLLVPRGYYITAVLNENPEIVISELAKLMRDKTENSYDVAIVDGLGGKWRKAVDIIGKRARVGVIYSADDLKKEVEAVGWRYWQKGDSFTEFLDILR